MGGMLGGALTFYAGDWFLDRSGGADRKRSEGQQAGGVAGAIVLGAMLDGIPESAAIGVSLTQGHGVGVAMVAAVFLSNVAESLSAAVGIRSALTTFGRMGLSSPIPARRRVREAGEVADARRWSVHGDERIHQARSWTAHRRAFSASRRRVPGQAAGGNGHETVLRNAS